LAQKANEMINLKKREMENNEENSEPDTKKRKLNPIKIKVLLPKPDNSNKDEWILNSTNLEFTIDPTSTIDILKQLISKETNIPTTKQRLSSPGTGFLNSQQTLLDYNLRDSSILVLSIKEVTYLIILKRGTSLLLIKKVKNKINFKGNINNPPIKFFFKKKLFLKNE
jgi:hypothetical protein